MTIEPERHGPDLCGWDPFDPEEPQTFECEACGETVCWCCGGSDDDECLEECCDECWYALTGGGDIPMSYDFSFNISAPKELV